MTVQDLVPERLGPYRLIRRLGEGGMGVVYLAEDPGGQLMAVKALRPGLAAEENARRRLAREVQTMLRVRNPHVAQVVDADVTSDPPYIVTRFVPGQTLDQVVTENGPLTGEPLARLALGLADALAAIHEAGVVHRDLKPGNVMMAGGEPVVIDFGIAQVADTTKLTATGMFMGTPGYLAPEVIEGAEAGPSSDIHSWGATVAYAATGRSPYGSGSFETIFFRIVHGQPNLARIPDQLDPVVRRALSRDPASRPGAAELGWLVARLAPEALVPGADVAPGEAGSWGARARLEPTLADQAGWQQWPNPTRPMDTMDPAAIADLLPPVNGWPPGGSAGGAGGFGGAGGLGGAGGAGAAPGTTGAGAAPGLAGAGGVARAGRRPISSWSPLVLGTVVILVAISVIAPVAGTAFSVITLVLLRAGRITSRMLGKRRVRRGAATEPGGGGGRGDNGSGGGAAAVAAALYPLALVRALFGLLLLAPVALLGFVVAAAATVIMVPVNWLPLAVAAGAGTLVAITGLGPGSAASREAMASIYGSIAPTPTRRLIAYLGVIALAAWAATIAFGQPAAYGPAISPQLRLFQIPSVSSFLQQARMSLLNLAHRFGL